MKCNLGRLFDYSEMLQETLLASASVPSKGSLLLCPPPWRWHPRGHTTPPPALAGCPCLLQPLLAGEAGRLLTPRKGPLATPNTRQSLGLLDAISLLASASRLELAINTQSASRTRAEFCGAWRIINLEALLRNMGGSGEGGKLKFADFTEICKYRIHS